MVTTNRKTMRQNHVTNCCFGNTGSEGDANSFWMVTSDENNEFGDQYLRFWIYNAEARQYEQHTRIEKSHKTRITSISLCSNYLVSCGDTSAKIWAYDQDGCWGLCDTFSYKGYTANKCAWLGHGGEYLAVAFGAVLTVWNVLEGCLIATLSFGYSSDIKNVAFVGDEYLVASDNNLLQVWNWKQKIGNVLLT